MERGQKEKAEGYNHCASCRRYFPPESDHFDRPCWYDLRLAAAAKGYDL